MKKVYNYNDFNCPKCDSNYFGGLPKRDCHGEGIGGKKCSFSWDCKDDWMYFYHTVKYRYDTKEEYEKSHKKIEKEVI